MDGTLPTVHTFDDTMMLKLARELAMDIRPLEDILEVLHISRAEWDSVKETAAFQRYLRSSLEEWHSALNTQERVKLKSLAMVEESLPEFYARMHDAREALPAKTEVLKTISRFAGVGGNTSYEGSGSEKMIVTINLGADQQLRIERDVTIEHEASNE
jgi:hypothetical protein